MNKLSAGFYKCVSLGGALAVSSFSFTFRCSAGLAMDSDAGICANNKNKSAPYGTDGRLFTTYVSANFKVT